MNFPRNSLVLPLGESQVFYNLILWSCGARITQITLSSGSGVHCSTFLPVFYPLTAPLVEQSEDLTPRKLRPWQVGSCPSPPSPGPVITISWAGKNFRHEEKLLVDNTFSQRVLFGFFGISCSHNTTTLSSLMTKTLHDGRKQALTQKRSKLFQLFLCSKRLTPRISFSITIVFKIFIFYPFCRMYCWNPSFY